MIKDVIGGGLILLGKGIFSIGVSIVDISHKVGTKEKLGRYEILKPGSLSNKISLFGISVQFYGAKLISKGVFISPKYDGPEPNCNDKVGIHFSNTSDEEKDAVISCYVKKGGCEVQTGSFRRADCR